MDRIKGSFRDPSGSVYEANDRIYRTVTPVAAADFEAARDAGLLASLVSARKLVDFVQLDPGSVPSLTDEATYVLEHPRLAFISMPYEWSFSLLKDAGLFHLDLHLELLEAGFTLSDASAYNVQFEGPRPIFIDHLSIRRYRDGEFWAGHRQFCEQFLTPLLLRAYLGVAHNSWFRGSLEGISISDFAKMLPLGKRFSWNVLSNIVLPDILQRRSALGGAKEVNLEGRRLPKSAFVAMLRGLRRWIASLSPARMSPTTWANYATTTTYADEEAGKKRRFVAEFVASSKAATVVDLGCNTGDYSKVCLESGAARVHGFDFDLQALDTAYARAKSDDLEFLPLYLDARNPSPSQGWMQEERMGFAERIRGDAVLALAFEHHLAIAHNVPVGQVIDWIIGLAPRAVIEFVPKADPTVRRMLALREDIFPDYSESTFERLLSQRGRIVRREQVSETGRVLFWLETGKPK